MGWQEEKQTNKISELKKEFFLPILICEDSFQQDILIIKVFFSKLEIGKKFSFKRRSKESKCDEIKEDEKRN